jgi:hypothetical protein
MIGIVEEVILESKIRRKDQKFIMMMNPSSKESKKKVKMPELILKLKLKDLFLS